VGRIFRAIWRIQSGIIEIFGFLLFFMPKIIHKTNTCKIPSDPRLISTISNPQAVITTDASPIVWGATFQVVEQNIKINKKREIKNYSKKRKVKQYYHKKAIFIAQ
jgi:hypothetical protein